MAKSNKEILYWSTVVVYGVALAGVLLYLRFPTEKFRKFSEQYVERKIPTVTCRIAKVGYAFPVNIQFKNIELKNVNDEKEILFSDQLLSVTPYWQKPLKTFDISSKAFGGNHSARVELHNDGNVLSLDNLHITDINLDGLDVLSAKLDRKVSGDFDLKGSLKLERDELRLIEAEGLVSVSNGEVELKRPILQQNILELKASQTRFNFRSNEIELSEGEVKGGRLHATFKGKITMAEPLPAAVMNLTGELQPQNLLYQEKRQLRAVVTRLQKKYKQNTLPFKVGGTIGRPTFGYGK